jgi:hypothetical protein
MTTSGAAKLSLLLLKVCTNDVSNQQCYVQYCITDKHIEWVAHISVRGVL